MTHRPKLTVGMACFDDFDGVYFSIQAARLMHPEVMDATEFVVIDNNPEGAHGKAVAETRATWWSDLVSYVPFTTRRGTAVRDEIFRQARGDVVVSIDCHVLIWPGALSRLLEWFAERPDCLDLIQGPLVYDDLRSLSTHMDPQWRSEMFGIWATDPRGQSIDAEPFEIPMHGLGLFGCRRDAWLGFSPSFRGFGAEEGYIHEKYRQAGRRTWCLPFLRWVHRFRRPGGVKYPLRLDDKIHNYLVAHAELGLSPGPIFQHFANRKPLAKLAAMQRAAQAEVDAARKPAGASGGHQPKISCLCGTWGRYSFLREAIASFLSQDYPNKELVILNQHPVPIACELPGVRVFNEPDRRLDLSEGLDLARRRLIDLADGELVTWWDDDDLWLPEDLSQKVRGIGRELPCWAPQEFIYTEGLFGDLTGLRKAVVARNAAECRVVVRKDWLLAAGFMEAPTGLSAWPPFVFAALRKHQDPNATPTYIHRWAIPTYHVSGQIEPVGERVRKARSHQGDKDTGDGNPIVPPDVERYYVAVRKMLAK